MFEPDQYQLLDFGNGRKLERFGSAVLDRPSPAAERSTVANPDAWAAATARFEVERGGGRWVDSSAGPADDGAALDARPLWAIVHGDSRLLMQLAASGNIGVFPEQAPNWDWIAEQVRRSKESAGGRPPRVLNLFAYTGGASLSAAAADAEVTHVDSSGPTVAWAKRNAAASDLEDRPVRWIVDDAMRFVAREFRRGNRYDGVIADPPTYGHGPKGRAFKFREHVDELMAGCGALLDPASSSNGFLVFSCHVPGFASTDAAAVVADALPATIRARGRITNRELSLPVADGRALAAGVCARWSASGG